MRKWIRWTVPLIVALVGATDTHAQAEILINSTDYIVPVEAFHCVAATQPCTLNAGIERGQSSFGALVTACFDDADPRCLHTDDPNYDAATGRWHLKVKSPFQPFVIDRDDMLLDFTAHVDGWSSPADNRIVLEWATDGIPNELFLISGNGNQFAGFDLKASVIAAYFVVRADSADSVASDNVFGPGLVLSGFEQGVAIRIRGAGATKNRVIGSWCGVRGDGTVMDGNSEHCIEILEGAHDNVVGGSDPADRNVFAGNEGSAIQVADAATRDNVIEGNIIGMDATGLTAAGNGTGITVVQQAQGTKVFANIISGNEIDGVLADNTSTEFGRIITRIEDNYIGTDIGGVRGPGNGSCGVVVRGLSKNVITKNNRIWFNHSCGVSVSGGNARDNTVTRNSIAENNNRAILVSQGANEGVEPPVISVAQANRITGAACARCVVEVFTDPRGEAEAFEGVTTADASGAWVLAQPAGFTYRFVTATATEGKNTSALSEAKLVERGALPTRTPTFTGGVATPTRTPEVSWVSIRLPWAGNKALH